MLKFDTLPDIHGLAPAMHGMRNPMNSWDRGDTTVKNRFDEVGPNDLELAKKLALGGPVHAKYRRMIMVWVDITAPLYWWKEFDTYKVGTVANSCSTMHKIQDKEFTLEDFSYEHLMSFANMPSLRDMIYTEINENCSSKLIITGPIVCIGDNDFLSPLGILQQTIKMLNKCRDLYLETKNKKYWWQMIQLLPSSYNQKRTVCLNYEVLSHIYADRRYHKLDEWHTFCDWIEELPHAKEMIFPKKDTDSNTREKVSDLLEKLYFNRGTNINMTGVITNQYYCEEIWKTLYGENPEVPAWMKLRKGDIQNNE